MGDKILTRVNNGSKGSETGEHMVHLRTSLSSDAVRNEEKMKAQMAEEESGDAGWG